MTDIVRRRRPYSVWVRAGRGMVRGTVDEWLLVSAASLEDGLAIGAWVLEQAKAAARLRLLDRPTQWGRVQRLVVGVAELHRLAVSIGHNVEQLGRYRDQPVQAGTTEAVVASAVIELRGWGQRVESWGAAAPAAGQLRVARATLRADHIEWALVRAAAMEDGVRTAPWVMRAAVQAARARIVGRVVSWDRIDTWTTEVQSLSRLLARVADTVNALTRATHTGGRCPDNAEAVLTAAARVAGRARDLAVRAQERLP